MLCIPVAPVSRTLAPVDLLNAARHADIVELCLDRFHQRPDIAELLKTIERPVLVSCRRFKDGGAFKGSEDERLSLLEEAIAAGPAYVELELDIAHRFPRSPSPQRVIAINRLFRALTDLPALHQQAIAAGADVVKYVWPGVLLDSLEPVLTAMLSSSRVPIVGLPIGHASRAFGVLAQHCGAPWVYAALERGMETHDGLPTIQELQNRYHLPGVNRQTRLVGAVGFGALRERTVQIFNDGFQELSLNCRCIPLEVGAVASLKPFLDELEISALVATPNAGDSLMSLVEHPEPAAALGENVDLLLRKREGWHGYNVLWRSLLKVAERTLKRAHEPRSLEQTTNLVIGSGRLARTVLFGLKQLKAKALLAAPPVSDEVSFCGECGEALTALPDAAELSRTLDAQPVPFAELAATRADVVIVTEPRLRLGFRADCLNPLFLQPPLMVLDATTLGDETDILAEARDRGCSAIRPRYVLAEHLSTQFKAITGHELPQSAFQSALQLPE